MKFLVVAAILFIGIPVIEFVILIEMGQRIGTINTLLVVFGTGICGAILAKMEGLRIMGRLQNSLREGVMPTDEIFDGALVLAAGVLLIAPGMLSDIVGLILLFPPSRYPIKLLLRHLTRRRLMVRTLRIST